jgi:serine/threonine protein kinase
VIHGDIKPQNMLVFKDATGKITVKVTDFGYSTLATDKEGTVFLPMSRPWTAPEHHFRGFEPSAAKKTDVYSFGMLCLWVLLGSVDRGQNSAECNEFVPFDASTGQRTFLERLKDEHTVERMANQLMESVPLVGLNGKHRIHLKEFFSLTVPLNPEKRTSNLRKLVRLLSQERWVPRSYQTESIH